jgi:hypothetical protein
MSALGHKRTYAVQEGMSALPPKADMCGATKDVRFVPIKDIGRLRAVRQQRGYARQNNPDLGELARLRIDLD